jgi:hypothetical protein
VGFVDDDDPQVVEDVAPAVVVGKHADVEHVGVRQDRVGGPTHVGTLLDRRVPVVDRGPQPSEAEPREPSRLVLRERLRRVEEEGPGRPLAGDRVEDRERERERLPGGRPGRDDDAFAARDDLPRLRLVDVEPVDTRGGKRRGDVLVQTVRERFRATGPGLDRPAVGDLGRVEERVPEGRRGQDAAPARARSAASS